MSELYAKELSSETKLDVKFENGKILIGVAADTKGVDATLLVSLDGAYFLDELAKAIPGNIDDAIIAAFKAAMALKG